MLAKQIRLYLMRPPRPTKVRITSGDKQTTLDIPKNRPNWASLGESIEALDPDLLEFFDGDKFLRAVSAEQLEDERTNVPTKGPTGQAIVEADPETQRLIKFAELLADAHKFAQVAFDKMVEHSKSAFEQLGQIVNSVTASNVKKDQFIDQLQRAFSKALQENAELAAELGTEGEAENLSPTEMMMQAFFSGMMQRRADEHAQPRAPAPAPAPTNGASQQRPPPRSPPRTTTRAKA